MSHSLFSGSLKGDPPQIYNWKIYALTATVCMGGFMYGFESGNIGGLLVFPSFKKSFGLDLITDKVELANKTANIVSMLQVGAFFGCLIIGYVADRIGRRPSLFIGTGIFLVGCVMQTACMGNLDLLMAGRAIAGLGVGMASTLAPLYTAENVPAGIRGRLTACYQLFIQIGLMISFWVNYGLQINYAAIPAQWEIALALQCMPGVILIGGMLFLGESPRYLARRGHWDRAIKVLTWTRSLPADHPYVAAEISEMRENLESEAEMAKGTSLVKELFSIRSNRRRFYLGLGLMVMQQWMGVNAINYYSPQIFGSLGLTGTSVSLLATGVYGIVKVIACLVFAAFLADTFGRRRSLIYFSIGQALCLFYVGAFVKISTPVAGQAISAAGYVALVCIFLYIVLFEMGWGPVVWVINSEIHSTRLRGLVLGLASATNWLMNYCVTRATPVMLTSLGKGGFGTFILFGACCFMCSLFGYFFVPETKNVTLEAMDALFGAPALADRDLEGRGAAGLVPNTEYDVRETGDADGKGEVQKVESVR